MVVNHLSAALPPTDDTFSIRVTADVTGISAHTLRMWQRRYGFPAPQRTRGGARRYSEQDIATLKLISRALDEGFRAGEVVGRSQAALQRLLDKRQPVEVTFGTAPALSETLRLVVTDRPDAVRQTIRQAAAALGPKRFVTDFAQPLAVAIGERWATGQLAIQQEHLTSNMLAMQLRVLHSAYDGLSGVPSVLLAAPEDEQHGLPLEMVGLYLALAGASARLLGSHTPVAEIVAAAQRLKVDIVGLSVSSALDPKQAQAQLLLLAEQLSPTTGLWLGGSGAEALERPERVKLVISWQDCDAELQAWRAAR